jgi:hypothetical protein
MVQCLANVAQTEAGLKFPPPSRHLALLSGFRQAHNEGEEFTSLKSSFFVPDRGRSNEAERGINSVPPRLSYPPVQEHIKGACILSE